MRLAAIDLGTLTCRFLIADVTEDGGLSAIHSDRRLLRLGEGVDRGRRLTQEAMDRVVETLRTWKSQIEAYRPIKTVVAATSAVREADNREEFVGRIKRETGLAVEILSGEEEARRTRLGIRYGLPKGVNRFLGVDIGGGSTEFMMERECQSPILHSLDIGVVRLTERWLHADRPGEADLGAAERLVKHHVQRVGVSLNSVPQTTLVGTAGTITTLAAMVQRLPHYDPARIHNFWLPLSTIRELETTLRGKTPVERSTLPGLERGRERVILAGTLILRSIMEVLRFDRCLVSDYGLREGLLFHLYEQDVVERRLGRGRPRN